MRFFKNKLFEHFMATTATLAPQRICKVLTVNWGMYLGLVPNSQRCVSLITVTRGCSVSSAIFGTKEGEPTLYEECNEKKLMLIF